MNTTVRFALSMLAGALALPLGAVSNATPPAGCFPIELHAGTDTAVGLPLERPAVFSGRIRAVAGNVLQVAAAPGWSGEQFAGDEGYFYCLVVTGELAGARFPILANGTDSVTVASEGEDLSLLLADSSVGDGDRIRILPYWTPEAVFAHAQPPVGAQIFLFDHDMEEAPSVVSAILTYKEEGVWNDSTGQVADAFPLRAGRGFFVRLPADVEDVSLRLLGFTPSTPERHIFAGWTDTAGSEVLFALDQPEAMTLADSGFDFSDRTQVLSYGGENSSVDHPTSVYTFFDGYGWVDENYRLVEDLAVLEPGRAYFVRIPSVKEDCEWVWSREASYLGLL